MRVEGLLEALIESGDAGGEGLEDPLALGGIAKGHGMATGLTGELEERFG